MQRMCTETVFYITLFVSMRYGKRPKMRSDKELARIAARIRADAAKSVSWSQDRFVEGTIRIKGYRILRFQQKIAMHAARSYAMQRNRAVENPLLALQ